MSAIISCRGASPRRTPLHAHSRGLPSSEQPLRGRQHAAELTVFRAGDAKRAREGLEDRLDLMMAGSAVQNLHVDVRARALREPLEEILHELGLQVADARNLQPEIHHRVRTSAEID